MELGVFACREPAGGTAVAVLDILLGMEISGEAQGFDPAWNPYDPGAPVDRPVRHQVEVKPNRRNKTRQLFAGVFLLVVGLGALGYAIANPQAEDRTVPFVAGSILGLLGLVLCLMFRRVLHTRTYTFTATALEGEDYNYRTFQLPWSDVEEISIRAVKRSVVGEVLLSYFLRWSYFRKPSMASLRVKLRDGVDRGEGLSLLTDNGVATVRFWNQPELVDSFAYGCQMFAPDRFRGVQWS